MTDKTKTKNGTTNGNKLEETRERVLKVLEVLSNKVVGHEDMHKMLLVTLVARENAVFISPAGCAKTYTIQLLAKLLNANFYMYLLTRFTTDVEIFGIYNIKKLQEEGILVRNWSKIVEADIVFFDEIFKANSAILNALLSLLNERIIYDPMTGEIVETKIWSVFGASNEVPDDEELQALYDRFPIRVFMNYLDRDELIEKALEARWRSNGNNIRPVASIDDIKTLHKYVITLLKTEIKSIGNFIKIYAKEAIPIIKEIRARGIVISDRTLIEKLPKLCASYCILFGMTASNITNAIYEILPYMARDEGEKKEIEKYIEQQLQEVAEYVEKLKRAKEAFRAKDFRTAKEIVKEILNFDLTKLEAKPFLLNKMKLIIQEAENLMSKIAKIESMIEEED